MNIQTANSGVAHYKDSRLTNIVYSMSAKIPTSINKGIPKDASIEIEVRYFHMLSISKSSFLCKLSICLYINL